MNDSSFGTRVNYAPDGAADTQLTRGAMEFHPACLRLPVMSADERAALVVSIQDGWDNRYPILTYEGMILDGRHRYQVAVELGVQPTFVEWNGKRCQGNPFRFVWTEHNARRSWLSGEQRTLVYEDCEEGAKAWDAERQRIHASANEARSRATHAQPRTEDGRHLAAKDESGSSTDSATTRRGHEKGARKKAELAGTNRGAVQRSGKLKKLAAELDKPEVIEQVKAGEVPAATALKALEEEKRKKDGALPAVAEPEPTQEAEQPDPAAAVAGPDGNSGELTPEEEAAIQEATQREYDEAVLKIMEADDHMSAAHAQIKQLTARVAALEASIVSYQNGQNAAVELLKEEQKKTRRQSKKIDTQATRIKELEDQVARITAAPGATGPRKRMII